MPICGSYENLLGRWRQTNGRSTVVCLAAFLTASAVAVSFGTAHAQVTEIEGLLAEAWQEVSFWDSKTAQQIKKGGLQ